MTHMMRRNKLFPRGNKLISSQKSPRNQWKSQKSSEIREIKRNHGNQKKSWKSREIIGNHWKS